MVQKSPQKDYVIVQWSLKRTQIKGLSTWRNLSNIQFSFHFQLQGGMKKHIFHLAWSPESLPTVDAISPLLDFLDTRLQDFNGRLLRGNVIRCLHIMWESVLNEIEAHVKSNASVNIFYLTIQ